ncbi:iron complex transport system substrate-binding protein [Roseivivax halotolerans]|uniref:Iron complex transport system substrate-binding protein n=1 Tax=Roseivivax halotolerans TaxID=93684 RepID=A0A1I6A653_9RHOB|nr:ABC transporter substrate-binding protein [Roseivivax halotolerans]SFQ64189.1 iron complex transport system substrate-binding protein [Roseivivax halotolerans]
MSFIRLMTFLIAALVGLFAFAATITAQEFPLRIQHKFGTTVISEPPERVATLDYGGADNVLALGLQPLTVRAWFGPYESHLWPWAQDLAEADPVPIQAPFDFEAIAKTDPDVILAFRSGITREEYERLTRIAPVVAVPEGRGDWDLGWREQAELAGRALGRSGRARRLIDAVERSIEDVAAEHPEWSDNTFAMLTWWDGSVLLYSDTDSSVRIVENLGLAVHPRVRELSVPDQSSFTISQEILPDLDADVIFWWAVPENIPVIDALPARRLMRAPDEGREIILSTEGLANGALANGSLLSLPVAIDVLTPMIEAAMDGNPNTAVPDQ